MGRGTMMNMYDPVNSAKEAYEYNENIHGCGYYSVCLEHDCPCSETAKVSQGFDIDVWNRMEEAKMIEIVNDINAFINNHDDYDDYDDYEEDDYVENIIYIPTMYNDIPTLEINPEMNFEENVKSNLSGYERINFVIWAMHRIAEAMHFNLENVHVRNNVYGNKEARIATTDADGDYFEYTICFG